MMGVQTNATDYHEGIGMKALVCWLLLNLVPLVFAAEELPWTPVTLLEPVAIGTASVNLGAWFEGDFGWLNAGQKLWITRDAGRNWSLSLTAPEGRTFYDSYFTNEREGWAVAGIFPSFLFHTPDGGTTWQPVEFELTQTSDKPVHPGNLSLVRLYFKDSRQGLGTFVIDSFPQWGGSVVARTDDGGQHWREVARNGFGSFPQLFGFGNQVWIDSIYSFYSPDFGETFQRISKPREYFDLFFVSPSYGWSLGPSLLGEGFRRWDIITTSDGGFTWSPPILSLQGPPPGPNMPAPYMSACLLAEERGAVLWYSPPPETSTVLYFTSDGGASWVRYTVPIVSGYRLVCNRERQEFWLIPNLEGRGGNLLFVSSSPHLTAVKPSGKLPTLWGTIKNKKEF